MQPKLTNFNSHLYQYKFDNLPDGQYTIHVVVSGLPQTGFHFPIITQSSDSIVQQNFCVDFYETGAIDICSFTVDNELLDTTGLFTMVQYGSEILEWNLYPNPNAGDFQIQLPEAYQNFNSVKIFNTLGELVISNKIEGKNKTLNFSEKLNAGFYWIVLSDGQSSLRKGFSVK